MPTPNAKLSGTLTLGDALTVHRLGFGAMRITGRGIWGPPADRDEAIRTLRRAPELGIDFIDTADSYGPNVSEELIREALHPYDGLLIATKGGLKRAGPDRWQTDGRPEELKKALDGSLKRLGLERIDLWQLHRIDSAVPRKEQFDVIRSFVDAGKVRLVGLSEVSVDDIEEASDYFPVASVQNMYNLANRQSEDVLDFCEGQGIGFIPWRPIEGGNATESPEFAELQRKHGATPSQLALAWLLKRSPVMLPIPGTGKVSHLEENTGAAGIDLSDEDFAALDRLGR